MSGRTNSSQQESEILASQRTFGAWTVEYLNHTTKGSTDQGKGEGTKENIRLKFFPNSNLSG
jgi:hypothetical protein